MCVGVATRPRQTPVGRNNRAPHPPPGGVTGGIEPGTPQLEMANHFADHAAKFGIMVAGVGGRARLKEGHAEKIDWDSAEGRFCFFQIVQGVAEPPLRAGPTRQNTPVCLYFSCLEFSENAS